MLLLIVFIAAVTVSALLNWSAETKAEMAEYCNLECVENKIRDHSICC